MTGWETVLLIVTGIAAGAVLVLLIRLEYKAWRRANEEIKKNIAAMRAEAVRELEEERRRRNQERWNTLIRDNPWGFDDPEHLAPYYICMGCAREADGWDANATWDLRGAFEFKGQFHAKCGACAVGNGPDKDGETEPCDGTCDGDYRSEGRYYRAVIGTDWTREESWSCWDERCVDNWIEQQPTECIECGNEKDAYFMVMEGNNVVERTRI